MAVLVLAEHDNASLGPATLNAISAAGKMDPEVHVLVAGQDCSAVAQSAAAVPGVARIRCADAAVYANGLAENVAALLVTLAPDYGHIAAAATKFGKNVLPRAAALLDVACVSDIMEVLSPDTFLRPIYAGNALATVQSADALKIVSIRATSFEAPPTSGGSAGIEAVETVTDAGLSAFAGQDLTQSERPELTSARVIISGGRGMQSGDNFSLLEPIADKLHAAIGASRAAVDAGFVPNDYQVGQTGKVVAPDLYIAVGISGAIQHLAGMKESKVIVAINKDEEAPIFQVADYGLVADLFQALPELDAELAKEG